MLGFRLPRRPPRRPMRDFDLLARFDDNLPLWFHGSLPHGRYRPGGDLPFGRLGLTRAFARSGSRRGFRGGVGIRTDGSRGNISRRLGPVRFGLRRGSAWSFAREKSCVRTPVPRQRRARAVRPKRKPTHCPSRQSRRSLRPRPALRPAKAQALRRNSLGIPKKAAHGRCRSALRSRAAR